MRRRRTELRLHKRGSAARIARKEGDPLCAHLLELRPATVLLGSKAVALQGIRTSVLQISDAWQNDQGSYGSRRLCDYFSNTIVLFLGKFGKIVAVTNICYTPLPELPGFSFFFFFLSASRNFSPLDFLSLGFFFINMLLNASSDYSDASIF